MATQDAAHGKVKPFDGTVAAQRLNGVLRASGGETARRGREGRNKTLVEPYRRYQQNNKETTDFLKNKVHAISVNFMPLPLLGKAHKKVLHLRHHELGGQGAVGQPNESKVQTFALGKTI